jgi:Kef-type K+ transport system membrane component KefB
MVIAEIVAGIVLGPSLFGVGSRSGSPSNRAFR